MSDFLAGDCITVACDSGIFHYQIQQVENALLTLVPDEPWYRRLLAWVRGNLWDVRYMLWREGFCDL